MLFLTLLSFPVFSSPRLVRNCYFSRQCHCVTQFRSAMINLTAWLVEETHSPTQMVSLPITWNTMPLHLMRKL